MYLQHVRRDAARRAGLSATADARVYLIETLAFTFARI